MRRPRSRETVMRVVIACEIENIPPADVIIPTRAGSDRGLTDFRLKWQACLWIVIERDISSLRTVTLGRSPVFGSNNTNTFSSRSNPSGLWLDQYNTIVTILASYWNKRDKLSKWRNVVDYISYWLLVFLQWYKVDKAKIREDLLRLWIPLGTGLQHDQPDRTAEIFLTKSVERSDSLPLQAWHSLARSALSWFISRTSINGWDNKQITDLF